MIDTILLKIPHPKFAVTRYDFFTPHAGGLFREPWLPFPPNQKYIKCVNNPSSDDKKRGIYRPRLTLIKRVGRGNGGFNINLHIELSLPKLMFGNNFDELRNVDIDDVIKKLLKELWLMGVHVSKDNLMDAPVYAVHYSKNIVFTDHNTASLVIGYLQGIKMNKRIDLNFTDFRNQGEAVRYYTKSHEFLLYDKVADLNKPKDRAMEKQDREYNPQMDMFTQLRKEGLPIEVLRLELRLKDRRKMTSMLQKVGIENDSLTLWSMFSEEKSKRLLQYYWDAIYEELRPVLLQELEAHEQFTLIAKQRPEWKPQKVLAHVALFTMLREVGHRKVRTLFGKRFSDRTMQRMYKDIKALDFKILNKAKPFEHVTQSLKDFTPLKKKDFTLDDGCYTL